MLTIKQLLPKSIPILFLLIISCLVSLPLLQKGLYFMHDDQQLARLYLLDKSIIDGQLLARWVDGLGFGFGYPLFNFYPPLFYYVSVVIHLIGPNLTESLKISIFLSIFISAISMYIFAKEIFRDQLSSLVAAVFYVFAPYRAVDIYIRGALSESFSFVWIPLIFWSFLKIWKNYNFIHILLASIFLAGLIITHNITFVSLSFLLFFYLSILVFLSKDRFSFIKNIIISFILACTLSMFFWLPALAEKQYTAVDTVFLATNYQDHFVYLGQLWNSPWGFGGSTVGPEDGISFKLGKIHILASLLALVMVVVIKKFSKPKNIYNERLNSVIVFSLLLTISLFMTNRLSQTIWNILTPLPYIQFPWRFLLLASFFSAYLSGAFVNVLNIKIFKLSVSVLLISIVIFTNLKLFQPQISRPNHTEVIFSDNQTLNWEISKLSFDFIPSAFPLIVDGNGNLQPDINENEIPSSKFTIVSKGDVQIVSSEIKTNKIALQINSQDTSIITFNTFYFPGWTAYVNGKKTNINTNNKYHLTSFEVNAGSSNIELIFKDTIIRVVSNIVSLLSLVTVIVLLIWKYRKA